MTQHELLEEGIDLERGAKRLNEINAQTNRGLIAPDSIMGSAANLNPLDAEQERTRKVRADAGKPRDTLYITPAKGMRLDISEPTGRAYLCDIMGRYAKAEYAEELASIGAQLLAIIERRK